MKIPSQNHSDCAPKARAASRSRTTTGWSSTFILFMTLKGETALFLLFSPLQKEAKFSPHACACWPQAQEFSWKHNSHFLRCGGLSDGSKFVPVTLWGLLRNPCDTPWDLSTPEPPPTLVLPWVLDSLGWKLLHKYTLLLCTCHWVSAEIWLLGKWILKWIYYCDSEFLLSWFNVYYLV